MLPDISPPSFLSVEFHTRFFPQLLWNRLRRVKRQDQGISFTSTTEMMILLAICLILAIVGIPLALKQGSITGWVLTILGVGGILALVIASVAADWGEQPNYDNFLTGVFLFFLTGGIFIGIPLGMEQHSAYIGVLSSLVGLAGGYVLGILAGLYLQHLGWLAVILNMLAAFAAIVISATALILLVVVIF